MRAGSLDRRVTLLRRSAGSDDGYEAREGAWLEIGQRSASIKPVQRTEEAEAQGQVARRVISLWLRADSISRTLTARDAVSFGGRVYELVAEPIEAGRTREAIELLAVAGEAVAAVTPPTPVQPGTMDFSDPANSGLLVLILEDF